MKKSTFLLKSLYGFHVMLLCSAAVIAQSVDTAAKPEKSFKNVVKLNISTGILYNNSCLLNYEQVLSPKRCFSIQAGYLEFPVPEVIKNNDKIHFLDNKKKSGFSVAADYRFI